MPKMLSQENSKVNSIPDQDNSNAHIYTYMDSYRVNERAWSAVLARLMQLREDGSTYESIGRLLKVNRSTVKLWLDNQKGGERTSFRDMVRYLDKLRIPLEEVYGVSVELPTEKELAEPTPYEKHVAATLAGAATLLGKRTPVLASRAFGKDADPHTVQEMLDGKRAMTVGEFTSLCRAVGISPTDILERAAELAEQDKQGTEDSAGRRSA